MTTVVGSPTTTVISACRRPDESLLLGSMMHHRVASLFCLGQWCTLGWHLQKAALCARASHWCTTVTSLQIGTVHMSCAFHWCTMVTSLQIGTEHISCASHWCTMVIAYCQKSPLCECASHWSTMVTSSKITTVRIRFSLNSSLYSRPFVPQTSPLRKLNWREFAALSAIRRSDLLFKVSSA